MAEQLKPVVIVGMHRSGTSLVGSIVAELGIDMGETADADLYNTTGYFEDLSFLHLNERMLKDLGGSWMAPPSAEVIALAQADIRTAYRAFVANRAGRWGVKDPRLSLFLIAFLDVVPNALVVLCQREANQVCRSLAERDLLPKAQVEALKARYDESAIAALAGRPYLTIDYGELLAKPEATISTLCDFLGVELRRSAIDLVHGPGKLRKEKRLALLETLRRDFGKALRNPSYFFRKRSYQRLRKYLKSALKTINLRK